MGTLTHPDWSPSWARAVADAFRLYHAAVGADHLLLGLSHSTEGSAHQALQKLGLEYAQIFACVEARPPPLRRPGGPPRVAP